MPQRIRPRSVGVAGRAPARACTLIELLAVIAVLTILVSLLLPSIGAAQALARRSQTRLQFSRWSAALELYRQEYGCYPTLGTDGKVATAADALRFVRTLSGRNPDGTPVADPVDLNGNVKRIAFCVFVPADFFDPSRPVGSVDYSGDELLCDAFGNIEIGILIDRTGDGIVKPGDDGPVAAVRSAAGGAAFAPSRVDLPTTGVRSGVLFFSAGRGAVSGDLVLSWK